MSTEKQEVLAALQDVNWPGSDQSLEQQDRIGAIELEDAELVVEVNLTGLDRAQRHQLEDEITKRLSAQFDNVEICLDVSSDDVAAPVAKSETKPQQGMPTMYDAGKREAPAEAVVTPKKTALSEVKNIIGVASGKGGVGKSTVAANLALALQAQGAKVGLCDLDIYGPSMPLQMGVVDAKPTVSEDHKKFVPVEAYGVKVMSIGFLVDDDTPVIWRGPIVSSVVKQFLQDVVWGSLDYLILDLPPGTGDAQLTLSQTAPLTGALIVTTPSQLALVDAQKGLQMFRKVEVPVLGLVENMSYYVCGACGDESRPFNSGGAEEIAEQFNVPVLARLPLDHEIQRGSDEGKPVVATSPDSPQAQSFKALAEAVVAKCPFEPVKKKGMLSNIFGR